MKKAYILLHSAILLAALSSIFGNLISLDAVMITFYRMMLAFVMLLAFCLLKKVTLTPLADSRRILWSGCVLALHWVMFYASIKFANVSVGVVCFTLSGFFTAIISPIVNHRRISLMELGLSSLTVLGISLIFHFDSSMRLGIMCGIVSALLFAVYATINEKIDKTSNPVRTTMLQMLGGTVALGILLPIYLWVNPGITVWPSHMDGLYLLFLAFGCTVCMCLMLNKAQKTISAFTVTLSFNLEPVYSIVIAIILFHEDRVLGTSFYVGLGLILLSLLLQMVHVAYKTKLAKERVDSNYLSSEQNADSN